MEELESIEDVTERFEALVGAENIVHLDVSNEPDTLVAGPLGELADTEHGGVIMALGVGVNEEGFCTLDRLAAIFPIIESRTAEIEEGWAWIAVIAGTQGVPRKCGDAQSHLRLAELTPLMDADLSELDLSPLGIKKVRVDRIDAMDVLEGVLGDEACIWDKGIVTIRDGRVVCTVAGMVALGRHPYRYLPGLCIELDLYGEQLCWRGTSRELEARAREVSWPCLVPGKNKLRELLVNALVHRGWRSCDWNRSIQVTVSNGTLRITHPGLVGNWRPGKSTPVNPKLFALFCELGLANGKGVGLHMVERYLIKKQFRPVQLRVQGELVQLEITWPYRPAEPPKPPEPARAQAVPAPVASTASNRPSSHGSGQPAHNGPAVPQVAPSQPNRGTTPRASSPDFSVDDMLDRIQRELGPGCEIVRDRPRRTPPRGPEVRSAPATTVRASSQDFPRSTSTSSQAHRADVVCPEPARDRTVAIRPAATVERQVTTVPGRHTVQAPPPTQPRPLRTTTLDQSRAHTPSSVSRSPIPAQTVTRMQPEPPGIRQERTRSQGEVETATGRSHAPMVPSASLWGAQTASELPAPESMAALYARWLALSHRPSGSRVPQKWTIAEMTRFDSLREIIAQLAPGDPEHRNRVFGELLKRWKNCAVTLTGIGELSGSWMLVDDGPRTKTGVPYKLVRVG